MLIAVCLAAPFGGRVLAGEAAPAAAKQAELSPAELLELAKAGPEHKELAALAGDWKVEMLMPPKSPKVKLEGTATVGSTLGERFVELKGAVGVGGPSETAFEFTIGFDRRHDDYVIVAQDTYGTYFVTGRGKKTDKGLLMFGEDDDPMMKKMGFKKKFAFGLDVRSKDDFSVVINFVDTRTPEEKLIPYMEYKFSRKP
jgi:hypothetical protein